MQRYVLYRDSVRANPIVWQDEHGKAYNGVEVKRASFFATRCFRRTCLCVAHVWSRNYQWMCGDLRRRIISYLSPDGVSSTLIIQDARRLLEPPVYRFPVAVVTCFARNEDGYGRRLRLY